MSRNLQALSAFCPISTAEFLLYKGFKSPKNFFVTISANKKTPAISSSLKRSQSQVLYAYCTKFLEKILQTGVHIHFHSKNIYGDDYLFPKRFMPASGSVKPFAGIISFWSHKVGRGDRIRTCDVLLPKQAL